jgi:archaetidylinositol phosphate synthase
VTPRRVNSGLLAAPEARILDMLVVRIPGWLSPDRLTAIGLFGAALTCLGFALALASWVSLLLVLAGLALNWAGDSLDGRLARHRRIERRVRGFILDNGVDLVAYLLLAVGFALSGLVSLPVPFLLLALYMMLSNLALARLMMTGVHDLALGLVGTTELRVAFAILAVLLFAAPDAFRAIVPLVGIIVLDGLSLLWALVMLVYFVLTLRLDLRRATRADGA